MNRRSIPPLAALVPACLIAAGCLLLPQSPVAAPSPGELVPALVVQPHEEEAQPSAEQLRELSPEERAVYEVYRRVNRGVVNITSLSVRYNWFLQPVPQEGTGCRNQL